MHSKDRNGVCEESVFSNIYNEYSKDLYSFLYYKFGDQVNINDRIQDAFMTLWINCKKVLPNKARAYLFRIGKNMMLNDIKHKKIVLQFRDLPVKKATNITPEYLLEEQQFLIKYQNALSKLTENQRVAFLLNKASGMRPNDIAELLGVTRRVIENRIFVAFKKLKKEIKEFENK